jgi:hypothetical protein
MEETTPEADDAVRAAVREGYQRILLAQGETAALQFLTDWLLAEPGPFLEWLDGDGGRSHLAAHSAPLGLSSAFQAFLLDRSGLPSGAIKLLGGFGGFGKGVSTPDWVTRFGQEMRRLSTRHLHSAVAQRVPRYNDLYPAFLAALHLAAAAAPTEDYTNAPSSNTLVQFVFRGGVLLGRPKGSEEQTRAQAHGVWLRRDHTWCESPVMAGDSLPVYSRSAAGFLRLPSRCPECERFLRSMMAVDGGGAGLKGFYRLQRLDVPEPLPPEVLAFLEDPEPMGEDTPVPG